MFLKTLWSTAVIVSWWTSSYVIYAWRKYSTQTSFRLNLAAVFHYNIPRETKKKKTNFIVGKESASPLIKATVLQKFSSGFVPSQGLFLFKWRDEWRVYTTSILRTQLFNEKTFDFRIHFKLRGFKRLKYTGWKRQVVKSLRASLRFFGNEAREGKLFNLCEYKSK